MKIEEEIEKVMGSIEQKGKEPISIKDIFGSIPAWKYILPTSIITAIVSVAVTAVIFIGVYTYNKNGATIPEPIYQQQPTAVQTTEVPPVIQIQPATELPLIANPTLESIVETPTAAIMPAIDSKMYDNRIENIEIKSKIMMNPTGIYVQLGDMMQFEIIGGSWTGDSSKAGLTQGCGFTYNDPVSSHVWLLPPEQRGAALIGYIGDRPFLPFFIGCGTGFIQANMSGDLSLGMSDCTNCFQDNEGSLYVNVQVVSLDYYNQYIKSTQPSP